MSGSGGFCVSIGQSLSLGMPSVKKRDKKNTVIFMSHEIHIDQATTVISPMFLAASWRHLLSTTGEDCDVSLRFFLLSMSNTKGLQHETIPPSHSV
jgi:hypothetical protein